MMDIYREAAEKIAQARYGVALTGAGISVESGIPDFRSPTGLWSKYDPVEYGYIESFRRNPSRVWKMILEMIELLNHAEPNPAHLGLAELEQLDCLRTVITQNIDSLHQKAGNTNVIEFHGHARTLRCDECSKRYNAQKVTITDLPPRCSCGGPLRPDFVFFGEPIPSIAHYRAIDAARSCDVMMVIGTSAMVAPASTIPLIAKEHGASIIEINPSPSALTGSIVDIYVPAQAGKAIPEIVSLTKAIKNQE